MSRTLARTVAIACVAAGLGFGCAPRAEETMDDAPARPEMAEPGPGDADAAGQRTGEGGPSVDGPAEASLTTSDMEDPDGAAGPAESAPAEPGHPPEPSEGVLLPILRSDVELVGSSYKVWAVTRTPTSGWKVELRPRPAGDETRTVAEYDLVGYPPETPASPDPQEVRAEREESFPEETTGVLINGADGLTAPEQVPPLPEEEEAEGEGGTEGE